MMGRKKLSTIRGELEQALSQAAQDPIQWLEERLSAAEGPHGVPAGEGAEVLASLRRVLEARGKAKRRARRASGR
jgi:hypothetical protein